MAKDWIESDVREAGQRLTRSLRLKGLYRPTLLETVQPVMIVGDASEPGTGIISKSRFMFTFTNNATDGGFRLTAPFPGDYGTIVEELDVNVQLQAGGSVAILVYLAASNEGGSGGTLTPSPRRSDPLTNRTPLEPSPVSANSAVFADVATAQNVWNWRANINAANAQIVKPLAIYLHPGNALYVITLAGLINTSTHVNVRGRIF